MGYWKSKLLPKIKKVFEKNPTKKAAAEACKSFEDSKEEISKEFEEKKTQLQPKVLEIYEASSAEIKTLVKERKEAGIKKNSTEVHKFLEELVKIEFPGSKPVCEASLKYGAALVPSPVFFIFEKISTFIVIQEKEKDVETTTTTATEEAAGSKDKEIAVEVEEKKEEVVEAAHKTEADHEGAKGGEAEPPKP